MENKTGVGDISFRNIWMDTDSRESPRNIHSTNKLSPTKPIYNPSWSKTEVSNSQSTHLKKENFKEIRGLFEHDSSKNEDDNISLHSIWTPTNNDNLKKMVKNSYENPLIDLETTLNSNSRSLYTSPTDTTRGIFENPSIEQGISRNTTPKHRIVSSSNDYSCETDENPFFDREISENFQQKHRNKSTSSKDGNSLAYESSLIDLDTSENSNHRSIHNLTKNHVSENISKRNSYNKPGKDYDSEKSSDELNEETFGALSYAPNVPELTLYDISEATAACKLSKKEYNSETSKAQNNKPRVFEYSKTLKEVQETTTGTKPKSYITKTYQQRNLQQCNPRKEEKRNHDRRNSNGKKKSHTNSFPSSSQIASNSEENLSLSRENLTIRKARNSQGKFRKPYPNKQGRKAASHTRETFHNGDALDQPGEVATRIRETFRTKGNMSYYTSEKITYIRGEKQDNASKNVHNGHQENIVWKNDICDFRNITDGKMSYETKNKKYFLSNSPPNHHNKGGKFSNLNEDTNYEARDFNKSNNLSIKSQNNSERHELKRFDSDNQRKPSKKENEDIFLTRKNFRIPIEDETKSKCLWQSSPNNSKEYNFDEPTNVSKGRTCESTNNHSWETDDVKQNEQKFSVTSVKVFDPKHHRSTKKKIAINQHTEHMKYKNSSSGYPQRVKTVISNSTAGNFPNRDLQEDTDLSENLNFNKSDKENKTFVKDVLGEIQVTNDGSSKIPNPLEYPTGAKSKDKRDLKSSLIRSGKEIADMIVGCERAFDIFKSFYFEWIELRKQSISLLEQIVQIIDKSSRKSDTMKHIIAALDIAACTANLIPHAGVAMGAKAVGVLGKIFGKFFYPSDIDCKRDVNSKKYEIREMFHRDIDSSSYVYMYGVQCGSQFHETCNVIVEFHKHLLDGHYQSVIDNDELLEFMNELAQYSNSNAILFYKKLCMCYEKLIESTTSVDSKAFVKVFEDVPNAISVTELLPWRFDSDGFDNSILEQAWGEIFCLFLDDNPATADIIKDKVQNCLFFLKKEHWILSRNVVNLFKETLKEKL